MNDSKNDLGNNYLKIFVSFIVFLIAIVFLLNNISKPEVPTVSVSNQESNINYKVKIFKNDYIKQDYMEKGKTYITDLVDDIEIAFNYKLKDFKKFDSSYQYNVTYKAIVKHNSTGKELWNDEEIVIENKDILPNKNVIDITENTIIDFDKINDKIRQFKLDYNIPIDSILEINLNVIDKNSKKIIASTGLTTNLNSEIIDITENEQNSLQPEVYVQEPKISPFAIISIIVAIISLLCLILEIVKTIRYNLSRKSYYEKAIYKILKNYGDIVAELVNPIDLSNLNVIDVKNFDQMLDVEEELRIPIMYYETIKSKEGEFVIVTNEIAYRYVLKDKKN